MMIPLHIMYERLILARTPDADNADICMNHNE